MDVVKVVPWERPLLVDIVDFEADIWRDEPRLDRGNIHARHLRVWVLISKVAGSGLALELRTMCVHRLTSPTPLFRSQRRGHAIILLDGLLIHRTGTNVPY